MRFLVPFLLLVALAAAGPVSFSKAFSLNSATWLARMNAISYCPIARIRAWDMPAADKSFAKPQAFISSGTGLDAYITSNSADTIMVVFKGTDPTSWSEWATDLNFFQTSVPYCSGCQVHQGFLGAMNEQKTYMDAALQTLRARYPTAKVVVTGHSLGGAIAQLYAAHLIVDLKLAAPILYTFGSPRVGNSNWSAYMNSIMANVPYYHVISNKDIVPHVPPSSFGFQHGGTTVWCVAASCQVLSSENDGGLFHLSITDHGDYLNTSFFDFLDIGSGGGCNAPSLTAFSSAFDRVKNVARQAKVASLKRDMQARFEERAAARPELSA